MNEPKINRHTAASQPKNQSLQGKGKSKALTLYGTPLRFHLSSNSLEKNMEEGWPEGRSGSEPPRRWEEESEAPKIWSYRESSKYSTGIV